MHKTCFHTSNNNNNEILLLEKQTGKTKKLFNTQIFNPKYDYTECLLFAVDDNNHCALSSGQNKCSVGNNG